MLLPCLRRDRAGGAFAANKVAGRRHAAQPVSGIELLRLEVQQRDVKSKSYGWFKGLTKP